MCFDETFKSQDGLIKISSLDVYKSKTSFRGIPYSGSKFTSPTSTVRKLRQLDVLNHASIFIKNEISQIFWTEFTDENVL